MGEDGAPEPPKTITITNAMELTTALNSKSTNPGDTLLLLDGVYAGDFISTIAGTDGHPITIKPANPGKAVIDGSLVLGGGFVEVYDLDFTDSRTDRTAEAESITCNQDGFGMFGCVVRDLHNSGIIWYGSGKGNVCENVIYNNGYSGAGHAIYSHNNGGGLRIIARNLFGNQFGDYTIHIYSGGSNYLKDFHCLDNIICGDSVHTGGGVGMSNHVYSGNVQYGDRCQLGRYTPDGTREDITVTNNTFIQLTEYRRKVFDKMTESGNIVYSNNGYIWAADAQAPAYTHSEPPQTWYRVIPFTKSARWVAAVAIYNRDGAETVSVDLGLPEGKYRLRYALNMDESYEFEYDGKSLDVPMKIWSGGVVVGGGVGECWTPVFGSFVIEKG